MYTYVYVYTEAYSIRCRMMSTSTLSFHFFWRQLMWPQSLEDGRRKTLRTVTFALILTIVRDLFVCLIKLHLECSSDVEYNVKTSDRTAGAWILPVAHMLRFAWCYVPPYFFFLFSFTYTYISMITVFVVNRPETFLWWADYTIVCLISGGEPQPCTN